MVTLLEHLRAFPNCFFKQHKEVNTIPTTILKTWKQNFAEVNSLAQSQRSMNDLVGIFRPYCSTFQLCLTV